MSPSWGKPLRWATRFLIQGTRPDLALLDLRLAQARGGIDLLSQLVTSSAAPRVLIVTAFPEEADIAEAVRLGAKGVVLKDATRDTLLAAIRAVARGGLRAVHRLDRSHAAAQARGHRVHRLHRVPRVQRGRLSVRPHPAPGMAPGHDPDHRPVVDAARLALHRGREHPVLSVLRGDHAHRGIRWGIWASWAVTAYSLGTYGLLLFVEPPTPLDMNNDLMQLSYFLIGRALLRGGRQPLPAGGHSGHSPRRHR